MIDIMSDNTKPLPCPFCGSEVKTFYEFHNMKIIGCSNKSSTLCPTPSLTVYGKDGVFDYKFWNRRV